MRRGKGKEGKERRGKEKDMSNTKRQTTASLKFCPL